MCVFLTKAFLTKLPKLLTLNAFIHASTLLNQQFSMLNWPVRLFPPKMTCQGDDGMYLLDDFLQTNLNWNQHLKRKQEFDLILAWIQLCSRVPWLMLVLQIQSKKIHHLANNSDFFKIWRFWEALVVIVLLSLNRQSFTSANK